MASDFSRYEVSFAHPTASHEALALTPGTAETVELMSGMWIVTTMAYTDTQGTETAAARDITPVTIIGGETIAEEVALAPITDGAGGQFDYAITLPATAVDSATVTVTVGTSAANKGAVVTGGVIDLTAITPTDGKRTGTLSLDAGYYLMNIAIAKGTAETGITEEVHIYPGLTTTAAFTFTDADLVLPQEDPAEPEPTDPEPKTPPVEAAWTLAITVSVQASQETISTAITTALEDAALGETNPDATLDQAWTVRVSGRNLNASGLDCLYMGIAAALPTGDIILDLSGCPGTIATYTDWSGSADERKAIRDRFVAINLPDSVTTLKNGVKDGNEVKGALSSFSRLKSVSGKGVTTIGNNGLGDCPALTVADFPLAETIGVSAFSGCTALPKGDFPNVRTFGNFAFSGCTALSALVLGDSPPTVDRIFDNLEEEQAITFTVPVGTKTVYDEAYRDDPWGGTGVTVTIVEK
jgi:hypothetical protein